MGAEEYGSVAARERGVQVLGAFDAHQARQPGRREPPGERDLHQRHAETAEMLLEQPLARGRIEVRKAQLEVAAGGAHEADRQVKQQRPHTATQRKQSRKRQQREQAQHSQTSPRRPVAGREQPHWHG